MSSSHGSFKNLFLNNVCNWPHLTLATTHPICRQGTLTVGGYFPLISLFALQAPLSHFFQAMVELWCCLLILSEGKF